jgi:V/A-type H+-transporting ATPase subunit C
MILLRAREARLSRELFLRALLPEGALSKTALGGAYEMPREDLKGVLARGEYAASLALALDEYFFSGSIQLLEKYRDDTLLKAAGEEKNNLFSIAPVVYYLIQKEREAKAVKMAMTAKLNGIQMEAVQKILVEV